MLRTHITLWRPTCCVTPNSCAAVQPNSCAANSCAGTARAEPGDPAYRRFDWEPQLQQLRVKLSRRHMQGRCVDMVCRDFCIDNAAQLASQARVPKRVPKGSPPALRRHENMATWHPLSTCRLCGPLLLSALSYGASPQQKWGKSPEQSTGTHMHISCQSEPLKP
jgi:hypothetical protein